MKGIDPNELPQGKFALSGSMRAEITVCQSVGKFEFRQYVANIGKNLKKLIEQKMQQRRLFYENQRAELT